MLENNLYSKADLLDAQGRALIVEIPASLSDARLAPFFRRAEEENLEPLLGPGLYAKLREPLESDVTELGLRSRLREAAKLFVGFHALAKYWPFSQSSLTSAGNVRKLVDQSEPLDPREISKQQTELLNSAKVYEAKLGRFLEEHRGALLALTGELAGNRCEPDHRTPNSAPVAYLSIRSKTRDRGRR